MPSSSDKVETVDEEKAGETVDDGKVEETAADLHNLIHGTKVDGGKKTVWQMTRETFGMAEGNTHKDDAMAETLENALEAIKTMLEEVKDEHPKWQFTLTPLDQLNATLDDLLSAFVMWSKKDGETSFNVSNAFRRLDSYATWMEQHRSDLEAPLTVDSIRAAAHAWQLKVTHATSGAVVWWIDLVSIDVASIKSSIPLSDSLRYVVWLTHVVLLDKLTQEHGMLVVQNMGYRRMIETMTMIPMDLGTTVDRYTIGVLPIKMRACYIFNHRPWLGFLLGITKVFMSKKMRSRMITIPPKGNPQEVIDDAIGRDNIPIGIQGLQGKLEEDVVFGQYVK